MVGWIGATPPAGPTEPLVMHAPSSVQAAMLQARARGQTIGFVPTMGALHDGHAALLREARLRADVVVCSIFINPRQFNNAADLQAYPQTLEADLEICRSCGVDIVFAPNATQMYPEGFDTQLKAGALGRDLEGASRPGHFDGMLTVVALLFSIVQPHFAVFGEKDYQQLLLVQRMVQDLRLPLEIVPIPVLRDVDGLALSSRNARLSADGRTRALALSRALRAGQDRLQVGDDDARAIAAAAAAELGQVIGVDADYVSVRDARTFQPVNRVERPARLLISATVEGVRLLDNGPLFPGVRWHPLG